MRLRRLFIDTGAFLALTDPRDDRHKAAVEFYRDLAPTTRRVTSWGVVAESYTWLCYHLDAPKARAWLDRIGEAEEQGTLDVIYPDRDLDERTRRVLARFDDQILSYVDGFSLAILQVRPDVDAVFAFDHHLGLTGLPVLPAW